MARMDFKFAKFGPLVIGESVIANRAAIATAPGMRPDIDDIADSFERDRGYPREDVADFSKLAVFATQIDRVDPTYGAVETVG